MKVELSKFRVKDGKSRKVDDWMELLNQHIDKVLLTLKDEKMYIETIFREKNDTGEYLYWYSIQGEGGTSVEQSSYEIDKRHLEYWYECIDEDYTAALIKTEVVMIPENIRNEME